MVAWDSADGREIARFYDLVTDVLDEIAIDPRGRYFAYFEHPDRLFVREIRTGIVVFETVAAPREVAYRMRAFGWNLANDTLWWQTSSEQTYATTIGTWTVHSGVRPADHEPEPEIVDGLLVVGDLAAPMDSMHVESHGGTIFVGADHYRLED